jgi:hypothetical protein
MADENLVREAMEDLENRTLSAFSCPLLRLVYLASTRDYNSGRYWHAGLADEFSSSVAASALERWHWKVFDLLAVRPLDSLVGDVEAYAAAIGTPAEELLATWRRLRPFQVLFPLTADPLKADLFCSNVKLALEILAHRNNGAAWRQVGSPAAARDGASDPGIGILRP